MESRHGVSRADAREIIRLYCSENYPRPRTCTNLRERKKNKKKKIRKKIKKKKHVRENREFL